MKGIELTDNERELLSRVLIEFRGREGIGLSNALGILYAKINNKKIERGSKQFLTKQWRSYKELFRNFDSKRKGQKEAEKLVLNVLDENGFSGENLIRERHRIMAEHIKARGRF